MPANQGVEAALNLIKSDKSKILGLTIGGRKVDTPGQFVPRQDAQTAPELSLEAPNPSLEYVVIALDIDAPFQSVTILGPILHWIQGGYRSNGSTLKVSDSPFIANYIGPAPPPLSGPHRYCFFIYQQPAEYDSKKFAPANGANLPNMSRMRTSLDDWVAKLGLGALVAFNYFSSN